MTYIVLGIIILIAIYIFITFNKLTELENKVEEAFSTMDVYLKKRWDLIPNLVEVVKGYAKHEKDTLENVIKSRNTYDSMNNDDKISSNELLNQEISKIMLLVEKYPEIKANNNFLTLSSDLTKIEEDIANSRKYYNAVVRQYNNKVEMIPSNIVALILNKKVKKMFEADETERKNIKVEL